MQAVIFVANYLQAGKENGVLVPAKIKTQITNIRTMFPSNLED